MGKHRMTLTESLRRRLAARRAVRVARHQQQLIVVRRARMRRQLDAMVQVVNHLDDSPSREWATERMTAR